MADESLNIVVSADTAAGVSALSSIEERLTALEAAFNASTVASEGTSKAIHGTTESATGLAGALKILDENWRLVEAGSRAAGVEVFAAGLKIQALTEIVENAEKAFAPLLVILTAVAVASATFDFFKDATKDAADYQSQMTSLGVAVKDAGGDWDKTKDSVEQFAGVQEKALGFDATEVVTQMNKLVTAGASVRDSEIEVSVAEEAARAKHLELADVVSMLIGAEAGRAVGLAKLDVNLKPLIENHAKLSEIIRKLAEDMSGQAAAAANTYEGATYRLHATWSTFARGIGEEILPALTDLVNGLIGLGDITQGVLGAVKGMAEGIVNAIETAVHKGSNSVAWFRDKNVIGDKLASPEARSLAQIDLNRIASDTSNFGDADSEFTQSWNQLLKNLQTLMDPSKRGHQIANDALWEQNRQLAEGLVRRLDKDPRVGNSGGLGAGYEAPALAPERDPAISAENLDPMNAMVDAFKNKEADLSRQMNMTTTQIGYQAAAATLLQQKINDSKAEINALIITIADNQKAYDAQRVAVINAADAHYAAQVALNNFESSLDQTKGKTAAVAEEEHVLQQRVQDTSVAHDNAMKVLEGLKSVLSDHRALLKEVSEAYRTLSESAGTALDGLKRDWDKFYQSSAQQAIDDARLAGETNAQKIASYREMMQGLIKINADGSAVFIGTTEDDLAKAKALWGQYTAAIKGAVNDADAAYKKWVEDATKEVDTLIDDIVVKHQRMQTELKSIFDQIEKNWVESISKMIASSPGFAQLFGAPGTGSSGFGGLISGSGGNQPTFTAGALNVHIASGGSDYLSAVTGSTTGVASNSTTALLNSQSPATVVAGGGGGGSAAGGLGVIGSLLGALAGGTGAGEGLATAVTGQQANTTNGAIGGLLGGGGIFAALAASGPLGLAAASTPLGLAVIGGAALLGAFGGSMIGPHYSATDNPDMYDESSPAFGSYDQFLPNYQGSIATINGGQYTPQNQYWTANGGTSLQSQIANEIDTANMSSLTQAQQSILTQLQQLNGGTTGDNLNITSEHQGQFTLASGQTVSVSQLESLVSQYQTAFGSAGGSPIYSIGRSYPDFNLGTLTNTGTSTPATGGTTTQVGNTTVIVQNPTIVGASGLNDVAVAIGQAMQRANNGLVVGSPSTYNGLAPTLRATVGGNA